MCECDGSREVGASAWTLLTGEAALAAPASEVLLFPGLLPLRSSHLQAVIISRSGRTSEAVRAAYLLSHQHKVATLGVTCAQNSELSRTCDLTLALSSADENS